MKTFEANKTYTVRLIGDNVIHELTVASRTAKMLTTSEGQRLKIRKWYEYGTEYVIFDGRYSMATFIKADNVAA